MQPGMVKLSAKNKSVLMPNLMSVKFNIYLLISESMNINMAIRKLTEDQKEKREELSLKSQNATNKAISALIDAYPEYKEFSEDFGVIDHIRVITSIGKGVKTLEITKMAQQSMIVEEPDPRDVETEEDDDFLS